MLSFIFHVHAKLVGLRMKATRGLRSSRTLQQRPEWCVQGRLVWSSSPPPCSRWKRQTGNAAFSLRGTNKTKQATNTGDQRSKSALARRNPPPFDRRLLVTAATEERRINNLPAGVALSCCLNLLQHRFVSLEKGRCCCFVLSVWSPW